VCVYCGNRTTAAALSPGRKCSSLNPRGEWVRGGHREIGGRGITNEMELVAAAYQGASPPPRSRGEPTPAAASHAARGGLRKGRRHGCWKHEGYSEYSCFVLRRGPSATVLYVRVPGWQEGGRRRRREACLEMPQWKHVDGLAHGRAATPTIMDGQSPVPEASTQTETATEEQCMRRAWPRRAGREAQPSLNAEPTPAPKAEPSGEQGRVQ
jgi:hypothetical protein